GPVAASHLHRAARTPLRATEPDDERGPFPLDPAWAFDLDARRIATAKVGSAAKHGAGGPGSAARHDGPSLHVGSASRRSVAGKGLFRSRPRRGMRPRAEFWRSGAGFAYGSGVSTEPCAEIVSSGGAVE